MNFKRRIPTVEQYVDKLNENAINEKTEYIDTDLTLETVKDLIEKDILPELYADAKTYLGVDPEWKIDDVYERRGYLSVDFKAKEFSGDKSLGIFALGIKRCEISLRGQGYFSDGRGENPDLPNKIGKNIWFRISLSYEHWGGGTNGCDVYGGNTKMEYFYDLEAKKLTKLKRR